MNWYTITNKADKAEVWIYDMIGKDFWSEDGVTAKQLQKEISGIKSSQIDLHINSPGGSVQDGITIFNLIKSHPANVTTYIDGWACSIASIIALSGDKVIMAENGLYMIHRPEGSLIVHGNEDDITQESTKLIEILSKIKGTMTGVYSKKTGKSDDEINAMMKEETWMNADDALDAGFIDEIGIEMDLAACAKFVPVMAKAGFKNIPDSFKSKKEPDERSIEKALRDAGCSRSQAKEILAKGWVVPDVREAQKEEPKSPLREAEKAKDRVSVLLTRAEVVAPSVDI